MLAKSVAPRGAARPSANVADRETHRERIDFGAQRGRESLFPIRRVQPATGHAHGCPIAEPRRHSRCPTSSRMNPFGVVRSHRSSLFAIFAHV
jgi:hypothetical protein